MMKKTLCILLMALVSGAMLTVDVADAARRSRAVRLRPSSRTVTQQPARTTTASPSTTQAQTSTATTKTTTPAATASTPAATAAPAAGAATVGAGQRAATPGQAMAPASSQGSGMGSTLLGVGAGLAGGYLLGSALSSPDAAAAANAADNALPVGPEGAQPLPAPAQPAATPAPASLSPVAALLGYDTASYCTQLSQGNADLLQQCTEAENQATETFRNCVAMSSGLNGIGSYEVLLRCLRAAPATR